VSKPLLKWLFEQMSDEDLVKMAVETQMQVPGFRQISHDNVKRVRPLIVRNMSNKVAKSRTYLDGLVKESKDLLHLRGKTEPELLAELEAGKDIKDVLMALVSSKEKEHQNLAESLFAALSASGQLAAYEQNIQELRESEKKQEEVQEADNYEKRCEELTKQVKKQSEKIRELQQQKDALEGQRQAWETEKNQWQKQLRELKAQLKSSSQQEKETERQKKWEEERAKYEQQIQSKDDLLKSWKVQMEQLMEENNRLRLELERMKQVTETPEELHVEVAAAQETEESLPENRMKVVLVAKPNRRLEELKRSPHYAIELFAVDKIDQLIQKGALSGVEEVWVLKLDAPLDKQRKIKRSVGEPRLREFSNFLEIKGYAYKS
jgi:chromosome segregation ATPase